MISYIIQVSISWIFFYGVYHLFLRKETFFNINRYYLMGSLILSLFIPQIGELLSHWFTTSPADAGTVVYFISEAPVVIERAMSSETSSLSFLEWALLLTYLSGIGMVGSRFIMGIRRIYRLYQSGIKKDQGEFVLIETDGMHLPFSFFQYVFISKKIPLKNHVEKIIRHELTHVEKLHSLDILLIEALHIFFWFNPVLLLYKKAIRQSHEYQADASVLTGTDIKNYGQILLGQSTSGLEVALANHFFNSQIKNRITMMYQKKSTRSALIKYLAAVPVLLFTAFLFSNAAQIDKDIPSSIENILSVNQAASTDTVPPPPPPPLPKPVKAPNPPAAVPPPPPPPPPPAPIAKPSYSGEVFTEVEQMPRFPGCEDMTGAERENCSKKNLLEYIYTNIKYPKEARDAGIQGMVVVQFVVNKDGSVRDVNLLRDIGGQCGQAATGVVESMNSMPAKWIPGVQNGKKVDVLYTIPVRFKLSDDNDEKIEKEEKDVGPDQVKMELAQIFENGDPLLIVDDVETPREVLETINPDLIEKIDVLKGKSAEVAYGDKGKNGVIVVTTNNKVDASAKSPPTIKLKPTSKGADPLIILDGKEVKIDVNNDLNPDDIESVNVLKGEKAIAKYGDKGKNGVVEITSKGNKTIKLKADKITIKNDKVNIKADGIQYDEELVPLYVLEGKIIQKDQMDQVDPNDIKSINVLKGKSALEKYGDEGQNGVVEITLKNPAQQSNAVYTQVDVMPRFPGCEEGGSDAEKDDCSKKKLLTFIYKNIRYPKEAREAGIEGMNVVQFTVMKDGSIDDISILRSIGGGTDEAVLSVIDEMVLMNEKWTPGMLDGKPVNVQYTLPIRFKLEGPDKKATPQKEKKADKAVKEKAEPKGNQQEQITVVGYDPNLSVKSLKQEDFLSSLKVFPNPASEEISVEINGSKSPLEIRVHNLAGRLLYQKSISDFNGSYKGTLRSEKFINTQAIISFIQEGKVQSQKVIFSQ
ncbi:MAG: TonB family protein [Saprospiraceae bacterium]|nr:TonB family protein [Saprospiraceae bacterium]